MKCKKPDHDFPNGWNGKFMECGYPLPCPWHTVVIETGAPRVMIPPALNTTQEQRVKIRRLAIQLNDAFEEKP